MSRYHKREYNGKVQHNMAHDLVIVGGGPAGVTAALRARELGAHVKLIERHQLGGTSTNDGVVPTRVLAKAARLMRESAQFADYGLRLEGKPTVDFAAVLNRTKEVIGELHDKKQLKAHLERVGVVVHDRAGSARFLDPYTLQTEHHGSITGDRFVLCVGGYARRLPIPGGEFALTTSDIWSLKESPSSVAIIGGGASGCQLGSVFEAFGARVTLLDIAPHLLMMEDISISLEIEAQFRHRGIDVETGIRGIERIDRLEPGFRLTYSGASGEARSVDVDLVLASVGWPGNTDPLNLSAAGVEVNRGFVQVNDYLQSSAPHIYAAGDITGRSMLVQSAGHQARIAVENALLPYTQAAREQLVPHGGFTDPEYGGVGMTEAKAREHHDVITATVPYADLDRAVIDDRRVGFCKLVADRRRNIILGAHVVGEQAVEIASTVSAGMAGHLQVQQFAELELAYPTFVAVIGLAARQIAREIGAVEVQPEWRELKAVRAHEWERSSTAEDGG
jgi:pyruvate/2-oxoglutarate dehydrogenase complex dihydrolipoamide dehydrogenase (E3) component